VKRGARLSCLDSTQHTACKCNHVHPQYFDCEHVGIPSKLRYEFPCSRRTLHSLALGLARRLAHLASGWSNPRYFHLLKSKEVRIDHTFPVFF
jgi:hypothetical protein